MGQGCIGLGDAYRMFSFYVVVVGRESRRMGKEKGKKEGRNAESATAML
jgi:hypothetical protein